MTDGPHPPIQAVKPPRRPAQPTRKTAPQPDPETTKHVVKAG